MAKGTPEKTTRNKRIVEYREKRGMTMEAIARMLNITRARVSQIYGRQKELERQRV